MVCNGGNPAVVGSGEANAYKVVGSKGLRSLRERLFPPREQE